MKFTEIPALVAVLFGGMALCLHGYLGSLSRYLGDDFCTAFYAQRLGLMRSTWFWYLNWSGRYSASIADAAVGLLGPGAIPIVVPLTILAWLAVLTALFWSLLSSVAGRGVLALALAVTSLFSLFVLAPDIRQSLYWGQGMRSVVPPLILFTIQLLILLHLRSRDGTGSQPGLWAVLGFLLALLAGGFSETYAALQVMAMVLSLGSYLLRRNLGGRDANLFLAGGFLGAICALVIVFLAPGNAERQAFFPPPPGVFEILTISFRSYTQYLAGLFGAPEKIFAVLSLLSLGILTGMRIEQKTDSRMLWLLPCLMLVLTFVCFPPAAYGTSDAPPARTLILPTYLLLLGLAAWGIVWGVHLTATGRITSRFLSGIVVITIVLSAFVHSVRVLPSRSEFIEYAAYWDATHAAIVESQKNGATQVQVQAMPNWAGINTPTDNPRFWVNECMSLYYGVQVLAEGEPSSSP